MHTALYASPYSLSGDIHALSVLRFNQINYKLKEE